MLFRSLDGFRDGFILRTTVQTAIGQDQVKYHTPLSSVDLTILGRTDNAFDVEFNIVTPTSELVRDIRLAISQYCEVVDELAGGWVAEAVEVVQRPDGSYGLNIVNIERDPDPVLAKPEFYPWMNEDPIEYFKVFLKDKANNLVMRGEPGTGKTTLIRTWIHDNKYTDFLKVTSAAVASHPRFLDALVGFAGGHRAIARNGLRKDKAKQKQLVVIVEDGTEMLAHRSTSNKNLAQLLNLLDGEVATGIKMVFSTNLSHEEIDDAALRAGRCFDEFETDKLTFAQAKAARAAAGLNPQDLIETSNKMSLAEATLKEARAVVQGKVTPRNPIPKKGLGFA